jgi:predicted glycogen debranching enzyme
MTATTATNHQPNPSPLPMLVFDPLLPDQANGEWLVTNGAGAYAMGSQAGQRRRRYHGLLVAALHPPLGRTLALASLGLALQTDQHDPPKPFGPPTSFALEGTLPVWRFAVAGRQIEQRLWLAPGQNTLYLTVRLLAGPPARLCLLPRVQWRDHHGHSQPGPLPAMQVLADGFAIAPQLTLRATASTTPVTAQLAPYWLVGEYLAVEHERGFDHREASLAVGSLSARLQTGECLTLLASSESSASQADLVQAHPALADQALAEVLAEQHALLAGSPEQPDWIKHLLLAADQFIVARASASQPAGQTVLAGYPWFSDWGRDTMIALPGLCLAQVNPARLALAEQVLRTFAAFVSEGMIPNRFPDLGEAPEYNTVDATLWFFQALAAHQAAGGSRQLLADLWPRLTEIIGWHLRGTRYGIGVDPSDGLLRAGVPGAQLTWMDAKIGNWVITPRHGKPIEVNALWLGALVNMATWQAELQASAADDAPDTAPDYAALAAQASASFGRFWNPATQYPFDVLDGPDGQHDPSIRPNAVIAAALPHTPFTSSQLQALVRRAERDLLTPRGLRSLAPQEAGYAGRYLGGPQARDAIYHQGTVWGWLLGSFALAHARAFGDPAAARQFLLPIAEHLREGGLGSVAEIFDGDAPHAPRGCFWQAWSVAEVLRAWFALATHPNNS